MDAWPRFVTAVLERHGVADVHLATEHGISAARYHRRTTREAWSRPVTGVRVHPDAPASVQRDLLTVCRTTADIAAVSREAAAWLHGLQERPPDRPSVVVRHATRGAKFRGVAQHRARWLTPDDVVEVQHVPTLTVAATLLTLCEQPLEQQRARIIDVVHRDLASDDEVVGLLDRVGPVAGKGALRGLWTGLSGHRIESVFNHDVATVLERRGYGPVLDHPPIATADGVDVHPDVALPWCLVAVEPKGDRHHRTREQRRLDRRRDAAVAGTDWITVPVDWRDWHLDQDHVIEALDTAIRGQLRRGLGHGPVPARFRH
jgi:hypothetical protein